MSHPKIAEVTEMTSQVIRFEDGRTFTRYGRDSWMEHIVESEEVVYDTGWLEAAWREYHETEPGWVLNPEYESADGYFPGLEGLPGSGE